MATINQHRVSWIGASGLPGVSTFYSTGDPSFLQSRLKTFFESIKGIFPTSVTLRYNPGGMTIDTTTGSPNGTWSAAAQTDTLGTGTGNYAAPVGCVVNWRTGLFLGGRELRGKTFLVPCVSSTFFTDGKLTAATITSLQTNAAAVLGGGNPLTVFSRQSAATAPVTSATVPSIAVVLRSRRD